MTALIIGGTGKTGRRVAHRLTATGHPVRVGSRRGTPRFDWNDEGTWAPVLAGCSSAYITYQPDLAVPGGAEAVEQLAKLAVALDVTRLVLLSGRGEEGARQGEAALQRSGAEWTVVRSAFFAQNFSESVFVPLLAAGELTMIPQPAPEAFVDADDVAEVVAAALTEPSHGSRLYEVTGPRLLTFADVAGEIGRATGRPIRYREVGVPEFAACLVDLGLPEGDAHGLAHLFADVLDGRNTSTTDGVRQALDRDPRDFREYVRRTAATGVWDG